VKAHAVVPRETGSERLVGWVLCHDVRDRTGALALRKGQVLDAAAAARLVGAAEGEVHCLEVEPGDVHEDPAAERLARAVGGAGVRVRDSAGGQWALVAERRGLLEVRVAALDAVNALDGISVYTLYDAQVVDAAEVVARAKVTPLVIPEAVVREAETRARTAGGLVTVHGFRPLGVAAVAPAGLESRARARFETALREKVAWFGGRLIRLDFVAPEAPALARALEAAVAAGAELLVAAGGNALDPLDPVFGGLERLGARVSRRGVPAHPGSLLWLGTLGATPVVGMPSCGMFSQATTFDLVLPRILAGETIGNREIADLGHGGLLSRDVAYRFPPYRPTAARGELE